jgi:hypothetical protein
MKITNMKTKDINSFNRNKFFIFLVTNTTIKNIKVVITPACNPTCDNTLIIEKQPPDQRELFFEKLDLYNLLTT